MDALTLAAVVLAVLAVIVTVVVLRRSWGSSSDYSALPLADDRSMPPVRSSNVSISGPDRSEISALLAGGNKIEAIKRLRQLTGLGLKEAKDYVEALPLSTLHELPAQAPPPAVTANLAAPDLAEVSALLAGGNKIEAIKRLRQLTGLGLKEAKDYVEALPHPGMIPPLPLSANVTPTAPADLSEVHLLAQQGQKIQAIKRYRQLTGVGLKEAKDYIDRL